jgi:hypothetical protein
MLGLLLSLVTVPLVFLSRLLAKRDTARPAPDFVRKGRRPITGDAIRKAFVG